MLLLLPFVVDTVMAAPVSTEASPPPSAYMLNGYYAPAQGCDAALNAYCRADCSPHKDGVATLARYDVGLIGDATKWRCYTLAALSSDTQQYIRGHGSYCTRSYTNQIPRVLRACLATSPPPPPSSPPPVQFSPPPPPPRSPPLHYAYQDPLPPCSSSTTASRRSPPPHHGVPCHRGTPALHPTSSRGPVA